MEMLSGGLNYYTPNNLKFGNEANLWILGFFIKNLKFGLIKSYIALK